MPDHEVRRPVGHRLRLRHEPLIQSKQAKHQVRRNSIGGHRRCEKNRKKNHRREGGSSARPCAPPRGGRVRSLPTWQRRRRRRVVAGLGLVVSGKEEAPPSLISSRSVSCIIISTKFVNGSVEIPVRVGPACQRGRWIRVF